MIFNIWFTSILFLLQQFSLAFGKQLSYLSLKPSDYKEHDASSLPDVVTALSDRGPVIIFDLANPQLLEEVVSSDLKYPFLSRFLTKDVTPIVSEEEAFNFENNPNVEVFELSDIPSSVSTILYDYTSTDKFIYVFKLTNAEYDAAELDEFVESVFVFLERTLAKVENVIVNVHRLDAHESFRHSKKEHHEREENDEEGTGDDDILSKIWTEGLLMCLLVSALLLGVLIVAITWTSSIEISYGALERSSNHMKKNK
ncbi:VOA1 (YGR106C) [Zygosaccharomyces parabailii]|nr:VOA1 (YGR106C) [Zygosaccharomyces parabailii]CDH12463.1 uncharacterized protein ZBAI_04249 [Zygosaccharomyces bailii ISA1307]